MQGAMQPNMEQCLASSSNRGLHKMHLPTNCYKNHVLHFAASRRPDATSGTLAGLPVQSRRRGLVVLRAIEYATYGSDLSFPLDGYMVLGRAHCFEKDENGKLVDRYVIEPITANGLECMAAGGKTSYIETVGVRAADAMAKDPSLLPPEFAGATFCDDWEFRVGACVRTWLRAHAQDNLLDIVPLGQVKSKWNHSIDEKRVLNFDNVVNESDNIKQDMSIDVYGRAEKEENAKEAAPAPAPAASANGNGAASKEGQDAVDDLFDV